LLTPEDSVKYAAHFRWDMSDLPAGSTTASGLTDDNDISAPLSTLMNTYMMAGRLHRYPAQGDQGGFIGYWVGSPAWDPARVMEWTAQMYVYMRAFHGDTGRRVYRVMGRMYAPPAYGGSALENHFVFNAPAAPRDTTDKGPLLLLTHEMGHSYVRGLQNPGGGGLSNNWFSEGLNEYYAVTLALRSGLGPLDLVLATINLQTRSYYTNPRRNMPADSVARIGLNDVNVQNVSYQRGLLFWADMDAQIRAATNGRRNLDSVVVPMMTRARAQAAIGRTQGEQGRPAGGFTPDELVAALAKEIGPAARREFDAVIVRGETLVPASNAFGPCFELRPSQLPMPARSGSSFDTEARPQSAGTMDGYLWYRVPEVPDERCRIW
jgi:predicted metalloprotease with PDZ domain